MNNQGAEEFPDDMLSYLETESLHTAILGSFKASPYNSGIEISPLLSIPKYGSSERRVILELCFHKKVSEY